MTVKELIQLMLELDDQVVCPRPSSWLFAAQLINELATHAEPSMRRGPGPDIFGEGWESVDVSTNRKRDIKAADHRAYIEHLKKT